MISPKTSRTFICWAVLVASVAVTSAQQTNVTNASNTSQTPTAKLPTVEGSLRWEGIVVLCAVAIMIASLGAGVVSSKAALFLITIFFHLCGIISGKQMWDGLVSEGMLAVGLMFIVVHPLSHVPVAHKGIKWLLSTNSSSKYVPLVKLMLFSWLVSPLLENAPHVAVLAPIVSQVCRELGMHPKLMLMAMSHCVVTSNWLILGSASNLIIQSLISDTDHGELGFFELAKTNTAVSFVMLLYFIFAPPFFFKEATGSISGTDDGSLKSPDHFTVSFHVSFHSHILGLTVKELRESLSDELKSFVNVTELIRDGVALEDMEDVMIRVHDELHVAGDVAHLRSLRVLEGLDWVGVPDDLSVGASPLSTSFVMSRPPKHSNEPIAPTTTEVIVSPNQQAPALGGRRPAGYAGVIENMVSPGQIDGTVVFETGAHAKLPNIATVVVSRTNPAIESIVGSHKFSNTYEVAIVGLRTVRNADLVGEPLVKHKIDVGDTILLRTRSPNFVQKWKGSSHFYLVESKDDKAPLQVMKACYTNVPKCCCFGEPSSTGKYVRLPDWYPNVALLVFFGVVIAAMAGVNLVLAAALGVCTLVFSGLVSVQEALSFIDWGVYVAGALAFSIGHAMTESGLAGWIGKLVIDAGLTGFPLMLLLAFITALVANVASNKGAIQVMFPIAESIFDSRGQSLIPAATVIANAAVAGYLTTYGLSTSLIIASTGQYSARDFLVFGGPLLIIYTVLSALMACAVYDFW